MSRYPSKLTRLRLGMVVLFAFISPGLVTAAGFAAVPVGRNTGRREEATHRSSTSSVQFGAYVRAAYHDFLGRRVDADGLSYWVGRLTAGSTSRAQFVSGLSTSTEWVTHVVNGFYRDTLGRDGDPDGVSYWVGQIQGHHRTVAQVAASFYASDEYFDAVPLAGNVDRNHAWVADLYAKLLHRSPDAAGLDYWAGKAGLSAGSRTSVATGFYQSHESCVDRVTALYQKFLFRKPDPGGRSYWARVLPVQGDLALAANLTSVGTEYLNASQHRLFPTDLATSGSTTCAAAETGYAYCWGRNDHGQLGDGIALASADSPKRVLDAHGEPLTGVKAITTDSGTTCAIADPNATAYCWGDNTHGQGGWGTPGDAVNAQGVFVATTANHLTGTTSIITRNATTCAIADPDATAYCWGANDRGQLGDGSFSDADTAQAVKLSTLDLDYVTDLATSESATCAIAGSFQIVYCWGANAYGQVGNNTLSDAAKPQAVHLATSSADTLYSASEVSVGSQTSCAIASPNATAYCWGRNDHGQVGFGSTAPYSSEAEPVLVGTASMVGATAIATDNLTSCAIAGSVATAYCWGYNAAEQLGNGSTGDVTTATSVRNSGGPITNVRNIDTTGYSSCAIAGADSTALCWGTNNSGQAGNGIPGANAPVEPVETEDTALTGTISIIPSGTTSCATALAGDAYCWGGNSYGQVGDASTSETAWARRVTR